MLCNELLLIRKILVISPKLGTHIMIEAQFDH